MAAAPITMPAMPPPDSPLLLDTASTAALVEDELEETVVVELVEDAVEAGDVPEPEELLVTNNDKSFSSYATVIGCPHIKIGPETVVIAAVMPSSVVDVTLLTPLVLKKRTVVGLPLPAKTLVQP